MKPICARPTCSEAASVRFSFDGGTGMMILDRKIDVYGGSGVLCERHADLLRLPKGWTLDDRRITAPRLFPVSRFEEPARALSAKAKRLMAPVAQTTTPLPLDGGPAYELPYAYESALADPDRSEVHPVAAIHPDQAMFEFPDQRTPLLARAFEAAGQRVRPDSALTALIPPAPSVAG